MKDNKIKFSIIISDELNEYFRLEAYKQRKTKNKIIVEVLQADYEAVKRFEKLKKEFNENGYEPEMIRHELLLTDENMVTGDKIEKSRNKAKEKREGKD